MRFFDDLYETDAEPLTPDVIGRARWRGDRHADGPRCRYCGRPSKGAYCDSAHREAHAAMRRRRREQLIARGLCEQCRQRPAASGHKRCDECLAVSADDNARRMRDALERGLCGRCTKKPIAAPGGFYCETCRSSTKDRRHAREAQGLCSHCDRPATHGKLCEHHRAIATAAQARYDARKANRTKP